MNLATEMKSFLPFLFLLGITFTINQKMVAQEVVIIPFSEEHKNDSFDLFFVVEEMPEFKYGNCNTIEESFLQYISDNIQRPSKKCKSRAIIQFTIYPDGSARDTKILVEPKKCDGFEEEVIRLINEMPRWSPGKQRGRLVHVIKTMGIDFSKK